LGILGCFVARGPVLGLAEVADELEMSRSTTHRYLTTLVALGFMEQTTGRKYRLTLKVTRLGMPDLTDALGPHLIATTDHISARLGYRRE
jgi:DNA-binding IclR family transcriptional regulator